jgi:hypothetical protein
MLSDQEKRHLVVKGDMLRKLEGMSSTQSVIHRSVLVTGRDMKHCGDSKLLRPGIPVGKLS